MMMMRFFHAIGKTPNLVGKEKGEGLDLAYNLNIVIEAWSKSKRFLIGISNF